MMFKMKIAHDKKMKNIHDKFSLKNSHHWLIE